MNNTEDKDTNQKIIDSKNKSEKNKKQNEIINESYNDYEMNSLNYQEALKIDKRSYSQYYFSLLKTNHILFFTFFQHKDYNSQMIKIYIFFYIFAINFIVNVMFYSDTLMHKIYIDDGLFDITYQIPQMLYSFLISSVLKFLLNFLGLYEKNIISIKLQGNKDEESKIIKIKIVLFFVVTYTILFFFWIYLGCFCAVYKNTQIHLLKESASSFVISFISPIFISLLPGIFRIISLNKIKGNRVWLFKLSQLLQLL